MTNYTLSPTWGAGAQLLTNNATPLTGGKIYVYAAGTTTPATTYTDPTGSTPLMAAIEDRRADVAIALLAAGAEVNLPYDPRKFGAGWLPLHTAVWRNLETVVKSLIQRGAKVDAPAAQKSSALLF